MGDIPIPTNTLLVPGAVVNDTLKGGQFSTYFNYGEVKSYGVDLGLNFYFTDNISLAVKYSYFGSDITDDNIKNDANKDGYVSAEEKSLNAPENRVASTLSFQNLAKGKLFMNISGRWVEEFDMYSGSQIGTAAGKGKRGVITIAPGTNPSTGLPRATTIFKNFNWGSLGGFTTFDFTAGYKINSMLTFSGSISNIFDTEQREFVGSPSIGRLFSFELRAHIPNTK